MSGIAPLTRFVKKFRNLSLMLLPLKWISLTDRSALQVAEACAGCGLEKLVRIVRVESRPTDAVTVKSPSASPKTGVCAWNVE